MTLKDHKVGNYPQELNISMSTDPPGLGHQLNWQLRNAVLVMTFGLRWKQDGRPETAAEVLINDAESQTYF